ncbi:MAG TPA: 23S rRNA pseudouridine(1911/1915/1917) synthase RluD [Gammaproteobacteria bacterium]|jgi:23S rRNA pseudouridine1911/1915/1917 synthase|uniref:23S rRNA pseudouridine(1911/1915/1917) synthase RluD n=1 Tax=Immundisolibacter sp. TaxID=1934948 RepID=UPI000E8743BE|nr:23S rRNA pseudouridine(1911/1915/1917) synthase RluD [Gammaproteobacteria bacterium]MCH79144.1 23S rRNA pseudouridine(1911/1915/1917) synthase RluD [Gammaproteobacteria bacterium]
MKACELYQIPPELAGRRLDQVLVRLLPDYSRSRLQEWVRAGRVTVDGAPATPSARLRGGEQVRVSPAEEPAEGGPVAEAIALDIVHEDADLLVVSKPAGLVVHPGAGNPAGTLMNALLHHDPALAQVPRAGIVHRLDKDTTGLLLVARTLPAHKHLVEQLAERAIHREYLALVQGPLISGGTVDDPIGRHRTDRTRMAVAAGGREAVTHYRIAQRFARHTLLRVLLETGRTHQIRVHLASIGHAVVGDPTYGRLRLPQGASPQLVAALTGFRRQALHAGRLELSHPRDGRLLELEAPLPADFAALLAALEHDAQAVDA